MISTLEESRDNGAKNLTNIQIQPCRSLENLLQGFERLVQIEKIPDKQFGDTFVLLVSNQQIKQGALLVVKLENTTFKLVDRYQFTKEVTSPDSFNLSLVEEKPQALLLVSYNGHYLMEVTLNLDMEKSKSEPHLQRQLPHNLVARYRIERAISIQENKVLITDTSGDNFLINIGKNVQNIGEAKQILCNQTLLDLGTLTKNE